MIFKRYSNPFSLIDPLIETNQFSEFIDTFNERVIEDIELQYWLHKVFDKSFDEFRNKIHNNSHAQTEVMSEDEVKATINKSYDILSNFQPQ